VPASDLKPAVRVRAERDLVALWRAGNGARAFRSLRRTADPTAHFIRIARNPNERPATLSCPTIC
jgi:hypothetical protein